MNPHRLSRRSWLKQAAYLPAAAALGSVASSAPPSGAPQAGPLQRWRTAVGLNGFESVRSYGYRMDLDEVLEFIRVCGFDGVELVDWPEPYPATAAEAATWQRKYDQLGLRIMSLQGRGGGGDCGSPERAKRELYLTNLKHQVDLLQLWGCDFIGVWSGGPADERARDYCKWTAETWAELTDYASKRGLYVTTEPEPVMAIHTYELLHEVVDRIGSPQFKVTFDPSHSTLLGGGDPMTFLKEFEGQVGHVHFTDTDGTRRDGRGTSKHLTLGDGILDLPALLGELKRQNYRHWIMLDLWRIPDIYRAAFVGKHRLDAILDTLFPG